MNYSDRQVTKHGSNENKISHRSPRRVFDWRERKSAQLTDN